MRDFYLVQRLEDAPRRNYDNVFGGDMNVGRTLNAQVRLDYMGSSEFEFGAVEKSANRIASAASSLKIVTQTLVTPKFEEPVYFVCTPVQEEDLLPKWHEWTKNPRGKEETKYFLPRDDYPYAHVPGKEWGLDEGQGPLYVGWWALNEDLIWTRDESRATLLKDAFTAIANVHSNKS